MHICILFYLICNNKIRSPYLILGRGFLFYFDINFEF